MGVVEELGVGQGDRDAGDVGFARLGGEESRCRAGLPACLVEPETPEGELGGEGEDAAVGDLEVF